MRVTELCLRVCVICADGYDLMDLESTGQLGSPLLPTDMNMLQMKPLRPFAAGEMCAFREALTPAEAAAAAAHRRAGTADSKHCRPSQDGNMRR